MEGGRKGEEGDRGEEGRGGGGDASSRRRCFVACKFKFGRLIIIIIWLKRAEDDVISKKLEIRMGSGMFYLLYYREFFPLFQIPLTLNG